MTNSHSTQIIGLLVITAIAVATARRLKRMLLTLLIVAAFSAGGFGMGYAFGMKNGTADNNSISGMILLGALSAVFCILRNRAETGHKVPFTTTHHE